MAGLSLLLLSACFEGAPLPGVLPSELSLVVRREDGSYASMLVPLQKNARHEVDVRLASGAKLYDGSHLWDLRFEAAADGWVLVVGDLLGQAGTRIPLGVAEEPALLRIDRGRVWLGVDSGMLVCAVESGGCDRAAVLPEPQMDHRGPGPGFRLSTEPGGSLRLRLPVDGPADPGVSLGEDVTAIVAVRWVRKLLPLDRPDLNRSFRGRGALEAEELAVLPDGDLSEWAVAQPLVVDARWQVDLGIDGWAGPRDSSFSVAASLDGDVVCFASRVRDDHLSRGDRLLVQLAGRVREIDLYEPEPPLGTAVRPVWFGVAVETCYADVERRGEAIPFTVTLVDADPGETTTVSRAAPYRDDGSPTGAILKASDAARRGAPRRR